MGSSRTRDRTPVPCIGRCTLNHYTTREVPGVFIFENSSSCTFMICALFWCYLWKVCSVRGLLIRNLCGSPKSYQTYSPVPGRVPSPHLLGFWTKRCVLQYVCLWEGVPHTNNSQDTSWVYYNSTQFWYYLPRDTIRFHRLRVQSYKAATHPLQTPVASPGYHLGFWPTGYKSEVSTPPPWAQLIC